ncbi:uncharacterized protein [Procambarus clarkii]|uniref:uncharacterized protein n=1 Tax=Procambarus clarkii TaxID=6728 RepID=UPI0037431402
MMDNKPEECSVCYNDYDDNQLRPRTLLCGHTFCSQCIDNSIKNGQLTCPSCRGQHAATAATQFPISYGMEALVRKLKNIQQTQEKTIPAKKKFRSMLQEQKSSISSLIKSCVEVLSQLGEYRGQLGDWKTHHLQLQDRLYALVEQNKSAMKLLELEDTSVVDMTTQGEEGKTQLQVMLGNLDTVNTPQEVDTTIDTADECSTKIKDWLEKCQELFPDVKTVHTSVKRGHTYRNTKLLQVWNKGREWESVVGGDYESNDGEGGAPLLPDLQGQYRRSARERAVWASIQTAATVGNIGGMYEGIKQATGPTQNRTAPLKSATGEIIKDRDQQMNRWVEHYSELYSRKHLVSVEALDAIKCLPIMEELDLEPTVEEVEKAVDSLSSGKALGDDEIPPEVLKCARGTLKTELHELLCQCWREGSVAQDMRCKHHHSLQK